MRQLDLIIDWPNCERSHSHRHELAIEEARAILAERGLRAFILEVLKTGPDTYRVRAKGLVTT